MPVRMRNRAMSLPNIVTPPIFQRGRRQRPRAMSSPSYERAMSNPPKRGRHSNSYIIGNGAWHRSESERKERDRRIQMIEDDRAYAQSIAMANDDIYEHVSDWTAHRNTHQRLRRNIAQNIGQNYYERAPRTVPRQSRDTFSRRNIGRNRRRQSYTETKMKEMLDYEDAFGYEDEDQLNDEY